VNATIASLTLRTLLGRRRAWLLAVLPAALLLLSVVLRLTVGEEDRTDAAVVVLGAFGIATVLPLVALIAEPSVVAVGLRPQVGGRGGVDVSVSDLGEFALRLPRVSRDANVRLLELSPTDESLESVFAYLVGR